MALPVGEALPPPGLRGKLLDPRARGYVTGRMGVRRENGRSETVLAWPLAARIRFLIFLEYLRLF